MRKTHRYVKKGDQGDDHISILPLEGADALLWVCPHTVSSLILLMCASSFQRISLAWLEKAPLGPSPWKVTP